MEEFRLWVWEHSLPERGNYILSLIGVAGYFGLFIIWAGDVSWRETSVLMFLVVAASFAAGRHCLNRFLYLGEENRLSGEEAISGVLRFHVFDADTYFAGLRRKLYVPVLEILLCVILSVVEVLFTEKERMLLLTLVLLAGVLAVFMVYVAYWLKRRMFCQELQKQDVRRSTWLKVCRKLVSLMELWGLVAGSLIVSVFLYFFFSGLEEPAMNEAEVIYRSYAESYAVVFFMLGTMALLLAVAQLRRNRIRRISFLVFGVCMLVTSFQTYQQNTHYTELAGDTFRVCGDGEKKEYRLQEAESFRIGWDEDLSDLQLTLVFPGEEEYGVLGAMVGVSERYYDNYDTDYDFIRDYAEKMLAWGIAGSVDKDKLEKHMREQNQKTQRAWEEILALAWHE